MHVHKNINVCEQGGTGWLCSRVTIIQVEMCPILAVEVEDEIPFGHLESLH